MREHERAEIIPLRLDGVGVAEIAVRVKTTAKRVSAWSKRFEMQWLGGLDEAAGRSRKPSILARKVAAVLNEVTQPPKARAGACAACAEKSAMSALLSTKPGPHELYVAN